MTLASVSGAGPERASVTDNPEFSPGACLADGMRDNPNVNVRKHASARLLDTGRRGP